MRENRPGAQGHPSRASCQAALDALKPSRGPEPCGWPATEEVWSLGPGPYLTLPRGFKSIFLIKLKRN